MATMKKLTQMKEQIEQAKTEKAEATGELNAVLQQLSDEFGIDNIKDSNKELKRLLAKKEELTQELEEVMEELESSYEWD